MSTDARKPQNTKLFIAGGVLLILALMVFAQQAFDLKFIPYSTATPDELLVLYAVSTLIWVVLLVFGFIFLRTLVKVWIERKQGKPGSRFKTSLLAMLGVLTLVPAVSVFAFAYGLVNRNLDKWLSVPVDQIFSNNQQIDTLVLLNQQENAQALLTHLTSGVPDDFDETRETFQLKALILMHEDGTLDRGSVEPGLDLQMVTQ